MKDDNHGLCSAREYFPQQVSIQISSIFITIPRPLHSTIDDNGCVEILPPVYRKAVGWLRRRI